MSRTSRPRLPRHDPPWLPWTLFVVGVLAAVVFAAALGGGDDDDDDRDDDDDGLGRPVAALVVAA